MPPEAEGAAPKARNNKAIKARIFPHVGHNAVMISNRKT
jgi:hypothetical protein